MHRSEMKWLQQVLHDLSQPLTAMECRLYVGAMDGEADAEALRAVLNEGLVQCQRLMSGFVAMQDGLRRFEGMDA